MGFRRFKNYAIGAAGMLVLVVAVVLATGSGSAVAAQITSVFVTNTASHPVPVHEQGTASVQQAGTPLNFELRVGLGGTDTYTIPAGKRLVIQYLNGYHEPQESGDHIFNLAVGGGLLRLTGQITDGADFIDEQVGPISVGPGDKVQLFTPIDNSDPGLIEVYGYLTDA